VRKARASIGAFIRQLSVKLARSYRVSVKNDEPFLP
jgi:hypothetical protein